ncbi:MAG TPA: SMC-Scp complex subunit ScpB [Candidatus Nanoarchaeia archaeon]|nr:SMC-Scp complex subunit ScpB [Candidatus Nanoarchaeia archaeon]
MPTTSESESENKFFHSSVKKPNGSKIPIQLKQSAVSAETIDEIDSTKQKENLKKIEAIFFVSGKFLTIPELISLTDLNPIILRDLIDRLKDKYSKEDSAIAIIEKNGMWKMDVRQEYYHILNKLAGGRSEFTKAEQETLAIIAFKQPIKQSVIIKIRGNKAYEHIKKFSDLELIRKKKLGHTHELNLSDDFYDYFGVSDFESAKNPLQESLK